MRSPLTRQRTRNLVIAVAAAASATAIIAGFASIAAVREDAFALLLFSAGLAGLIALIWILQAVDSLQSRDVELLTRAVEALHGHPAPHLAAPDRAHVSDRVARLQSAIAALLEQVAAPTGPTESRMAAVLGMIPEGVVVVNEAGLITLVNQAAIETVGPGRLEPGTSIFDVFERHGWRQALQTMSGERVAQAALLTAYGTMLDVRLRNFADHGGTIVILPAPATGAASGMRHALERHEADVVRRPPAPQTPLERLTVVAPDCETTGLNVALDRIISIAAVEIDGIRIIGGSSVDLLIDPQQPIPASTTAIHGISDAMVRGAPTLAEAWPSIEPFLRDCVIVGHNIGFDLTLLEIELRRAGIAWKRPPSLCTLQLVAAIDTSLGDLNLEAVARAYGVEVDGRHTALGDALVTAEVYLRLASLMRQAGDVTLADAQARAATARRVIRQQQAAGW